MKLVRFSVLGLILFAGWPGSLSADQTNNSSLEYKKSSGPHAVEVVRYEWLDQKRERKVPVKIYFPKTGDGPFPVVIFSHGLGGSREGYEYLGRHWASHGYVSVHVQHLGSDTAVWQNSGAGEAMENMRKAAANLQNATNRPIDVSFAIDQMEKMNREEGPLKKRLDLDRIGVAGHSFGAFTTLAIAGETLIAPGGREASLGDARVKAAIPMSAPVPRIKARLDRAFGTIKIPCLHMTGTKDSSPIGQTTAEERRLPFDHMHGADQFLITFKDGDHMIFSGRGRARGGEKDEHFQTHIRMSSMAFWDGYLKGDAQAKAWLTGDGFERVLGEAGKFEKKVASAQEKSKTKILTQGR